MGNSIGSIITPEQDKLEERSKICTKFKACKQDKLYRELSKSRGLKLSTKKRTKKMKKLKKRYSK